MAQVTGTNGRDVIHILGDGTPIPAGFNDIPEATNANDSINALAGDDIVVAGGGADLIRGLDGDDTLFGGAGADTLVGNAGFDTARYTGSAAGVTLVLSNPNLLGLGGDAQGDKLAGIENISGSAFADRLSGSDAANVLSGVAGDDVLNGAGGNDQLSGGDGDDRLTGGAGGDRLLGGDGIDTADFGGSTAGVRVDLALGRGTFNAAQGDTYSGIENVVATNGRDILIGDDQANSFFGADASDMLIGNLGADTLRGGFGSDTANYSASAAAVNVNLDEARGRFGDAQGDVYDSIERVVGSANSDTIAGNADANILNGLGGRDFLSGEAGADTFEYSRAAHSRAGAATRDQIGDFDADEGDIIDLSAIDANTLDPGDQAFDFIGNAGFTGSPGELNYVFGILAGDLDGDTDADLEIVLFGARPIAEENLDL